MWGNKHGTFFCPIFNYYSKRVKHRVRAHLGCYISMTTVRKFSFWQMIKLNLISTHYSCSLLCAMGPISSLERHLTISTPNIASFDHLAHYRSSNQRGSMKGPTKNTTQRHLTRSKGTQQVSIGSTEVHIVAASNYHHKCW